MTTRPRPALRSLGALAGAAALTAALVPLGAAPAIADQDPPAPSAPITAGPDPAADSGSAEQAEDEAYIWAFFTGEGVGGERISLAASRGNDALDWNTLNDGEPLFDSEFGEEGLRDPFILRSPEGDRFYLIATDLKIDGRQIGRASCRERV